MSKPEFRPGFRISIIDGIAIVLGVISSLYFWLSEWSLGFVILVVVGHFFLFCNVFRIARKLELIWASVFGVLAFSTITTDDPSWPVTMIISLAVTAVVIGVEMTKPSYHGVGWRWINPHLRQWWEASIVERSS